MKTDIRKKLESNIMDDLAEPGWILGDSREYAVDPAEFRTFMAETHPKLVEVFDLGDSRLTRHASKEFRPSVDFLPRLASARKARTYAE